jgi:hypothetical protein
MAINRLSTGGPIIAQFNRQTATTYTFLLSDANLIVEGSNAGATTFTIPADSTSNFPIGSTITIIQSGNGQITVAGAGGVTLNGTPGAKLRTLWSTATITKRLANTWIIYGDVVA